MWVRRGRAKTAAPAGSRCHKITYACLGSMRCTQGLIYTFWKNPLLLSLSRAIKGVGSIVCRKLEAPLDPKPARRPQSLNADWRPRCDAVTRASVVTSAFSVLYHMGCSEHPRAFHLPSATVRTLEGSLRASSWQVDVDNFRSDS